MLSFLKNHPFAVEAFFRQSLVLTFAIPAERLQHLVPPCLSPDTFENKWAFIAVAMVDTKNLRPKGFPKGLGQDFFLMGYRVFVRYTTGNGKRLRGLYILKSETNKNRMAFFGNIFTHYRYSCADIVQKNEKGLATIRSNRSGLDVSCRLPGETVPDLPAGSPFTSWKEARRFAGPLPFTFTYDQQRNNVLVIEGVRENWQPKPLQVLSYRLPFLDSLAVGQPILASAFIVENIPYHWKKGRIEKWKRENHSRECSIS